MNRLSTAGCVPPAVYIGCPLFVLAKSRSGQLSTTPRGAKETVGFRATRPVGTLFCPAPPRPGRAPPPRRAQRRPGPPVVCSGFGFDNLNCISLVRSPEKTLRPAVRRPVPTRPWYVRVVVSTNRKHEQIKLVESKTRTYHGLVGSGRRTAGRRSGARQDGTPTERFALETTVPRSPRSIEKNVLNEKNEQAKSHLNR